MNTRASHVLDRCLAPGVFGIVLLLTCGALCLWYVPYGLPTPDAGAALVHAARIAGGAVFYRDLDAYPFPAASYLLAAAMGVFGESLTVARVGAAVMFTSIVLASYRLALELGGRGAAALCALAVLSLKFLAWPAFQEWFYPEVALSFALWSMIAWFRFRARGSRSALLVAAFLAGLTILSKQNLGIYLAAAMAGLLLLSLVVRTGDRRTVPADFAILALAGVAPITAAVLFFWWHGVLGQMLYSGLVRPFSGYMPTSGLPFLVPLEWWRFGELQGQTGFAYSIGPVFEMLGMRKLPMASWYPWFWHAEEAAVRLLYTAIPLTFAAAAFAIARQRALRRDVESLVALTVFSLATLGSAFPRADYYHIASVYPAILVLAIVAGSRLLAGARRSWITAAVSVAATGIVCGVFLVTLVLAGWYFRAMTYEAGNDRGHMRIYPENAWIDDVIRYVDAQPASDGGLFVYGHEAYYYYFSGRYWSWPFVQLYPGMTGDDDGAQLAESLAENPPALIVRGLIAGWPGLPEVSSYASRLQTFIDTHYQPTAKPFVDGLGPNAQPPPGWLLQVLERKPPAE